MGSNHPLIADLYGTLRLPLVVAPMFLISGPDLVIAAGKAGVIAAFPAANARTLDDLSAWLRRIDEDLADAGRAGQWAVNMIVHPTYDRFEAERDLIAEHRPRIVITALGGPKRVLDPVHGYGGAVFCDVTTVLHAQKAVDAGADGLVLVASGAGGHTGAYSPFAFVEEVRRFWDGPLILGGAISSARSLRAALTLGAWNVPISMSTSWPPRRKSTFPTYPAGRKPGKTFGAPDMASVRRPAYRASQT
jgi:nitronate monooxygenase